MKPRIFIGSSVEKLEIAELIQSNLEHVAYPEIWTQNIFELSATTIESLFDSLNQVDYAIFILSPDDIVEIRSTKTPAVRDNVIFELGLFMGKLGRDRVFYIIPRNEEIHLPTDLLGITPGTYDPEHPSKIAALGPFCTQVKLQIKKTYHPEFPPSNHIGENILHKSLINLKSEIDYSFDTTTPSKFNLKIILKNESIDPTENTWSMLLGLNDGWIYDKYSRESNSQTYRINGGKNGKFQIIFKGKGNAELQFYREDKLFDTKKIAWN